MKKFWRNVHLYLSIIAGLIFFVECLSGCLLVFEDEITQLTYPKRFYTSETATARLPIDELVNVLNGQLSPGEQIAGFTVYANPKRTMEVSLKKKEKKAAKGATKEKSGRRASGEQLYVNPYTGAVTARVNPNDGTFFKTMLKIHQTLLLNDIGKTILGISTFIVLVIILTGIILWWPKNMKILKHRLKLKTQGSWKRINHDLHVVLGFYCSFFLLIFLVTSLPWSFKWANDALYTITNSKPAKKEDIKLEAAGVERNHLTWQQLLDITQSRLPEAPSWRLTYQRGELTEPVQTSSPSTSVLHRNGFDQLAINPYTGVIISESMHDKSPGGWQLRRYMKPVHTGAIGGIPTKVIAFLVCLIAATFPITGFILWLNRTRKSEKRKKRIN
ncbi:PepSY-associated TM helix domain-containing protein [Sphingobacterium sp. MYb382]|uniref:PepSY-associated TM helix domain-containing protein n=1 Tax=Sphingobacterium sp. MYb382 TaxID=2745278 RepID=UPI0030AAB165